MQRLHATIDPAYFSASFKPMNHLVSVLSAEARHRHDAGHDEEEEEDDDGSDEEGEDVVRVHTLEGKVGRVRGLSRHSTVAELRAAVQEQMGVRIEYQRLYVESGPWRFVLEHSTLELLNDGSRRLGEFGIFPPTVHLRNREYEALRSQLQVATEVVEDFLEKHYDEFARSIAEAQRMSSQYENLVKNIAETRRLVADARSNLGLEHYDGAHKKTDGSSSPSSLLADDCSDDAHPSKKNRVLEHWEQLVEADEALSLLDELRSRCLHDSS